MLDLLKSKDDQKISKASGIYVNFFKPFFDIIIAFASLIATSLLLVIISLVIKFDSEGPAIFRQSRIGLNGKEFSIYKFRTMYVNVPKEGRSPINGDDPRITKVGRFLRKTSLDELPQLINILKGDMSFVGPRPEQKSIVEKYYTKYEKKRLMVKPGITGSWQVSMDRTKPIHENLEYDLKYISECSFLLDLKIIIKTLGVLLKSNTF